MLFRSTLQDNKIRKIGSLVFHPKKKNILIIGSKNKKINFFDIDEKKIIKTLIADEYMNSKDIRFSDDNKFMLIIGNAAYLWNLNTNKQIDIINGDKIIGGMFIPNSSKFITIGKEISTWKIN